MLTGSFRLIPFPANFYTASNDWPITFSQGLKLGVYSNHGTNSWPRSLVAGNDPCTMSADILAILTNPEAIAVNRNGNNRQGRRTSAAESTTRSFELGIGAHQFQFVRPGAFEGFSQNNLMAQMAWVLVC